MACDKHGASLKVGDRIIDERPWDIAFVGRIERIYAHPLGTAIDYREIRSGHLRTTLAERVRYDFTQLDVPGQPRVEDDAFM